MSTKANAQILIIEDDFAIREALISVLEFEGYGVTTAEDGQDAVEKLEGGLSPDVILLDLNMPRLSGREFLKVRASRNLCADSRIVVFAATKDIEDLPDVTTWIRKPADLDLILSEIHRLL